MRINISHTFHITKTRIARPQMPFGHEALPVHPLLLIKGAMSRFAHLENFRLNLSISISFMVLWLITITSFIFVSGRNNSQ